MSLLKSVRKGRKLKPLALMLHAPRGIGKSTFASEAPNPIYVGQEENDELDVARFPKVKEWKDLHEQLKTLRDEDHDYKTLVLDTVDGLEQTATVEILKGTKYASLNTYQGGYGKGTDELANMFMTIRDEYLIPIRDKKGMNVILLCHTKKKKHEEPQTNTSYDTYETAIHDKVKCLFEDWVSAILFANYRLFKAEDEQGKVFTAGNEGERVIFTEERPSHSAKNRFDFPSEIEFKRKGTWNEIKKLVLKHFKTVKKKVEEKGEKFDDELENIKKAIKEKLPKLPEEVKPHLEAKYEKLKTADEAKKLLNKVEGALA